MACELNILDIPVSASAPGADDYVIFTLPDGTSVIRKWSDIMAGTIPDDIDTIVLASGGEINTGDTNKTFAQFVGKRVRLIRGHISQSIAAGEFSYDSASGNVSWSPAAFVDEVFQLQAY